METVGTVNGSSETEAAKTPELKLVVGLGNPGTEYAGTRHNMGFMALDRLMGEAEECRMCDWQPREGLLQQVRLADRWVYVLKPMTFMNGSGRAVGEAAGRLGISPQEMLVVSDDLDMPLGRLRLRMKGSCGGHRGLASIAEYLGCQDFPRLRLGIGRPQPGSESIVDYVLEGWTSDDSRLLACVLGAACGIIREGAAQGVTGCTQVVSVELSDKDNAEVQGAEH